LTLIAQSRAVILAGMEATADYYATLRVAPDADDECLRLAYLDLMRRYHPDVNVADNSCEKSKAINEAYACLRDPLKRAAYDGRRRNYERSRRAGSPLSPRAYQPSWGAERAGDLVREAAAQSKGWKAAILGGALLATIATFAATSAVDAPVAAEDQPATIVMKARPQQLPDHRP
jgi:curved DNA-binding protein CbpA